MRYYLGIDGGGTKTTALLCDEDMREIASFTGGGINYRAIGMRDAKENLSRTVRGALRNGEYSPSAVFIGHSALSDPADADFIRDFCENAVPCDTIGMDSDLFIALRAMETDGPAAVAICGTGSMAAGRLRDGRVIHTGGWGHLLGDEGSGFAIALDALKAALRGGEGAGPQTVLSALFPRHFGIDSPEELIELVYAPTLPRSRIAAFAPEVIRSAENGDVVAKRIVADHATRFAETVTALLAKLPTGAPLGLWGGILTYQPTFTEAFKRNVKQAYPATRIEPLPHPPEYGAALAARELYRERKPL